MDRITKLIVKRHQQVSEHRLPAEDVERLTDMFSSVESGDERARPSKYWVELNRMNLAQLEQHGYENFKRTVALNYFTFVRILPWDAQIVFLLRKLPLHTGISCIRRAFVARKHDYFSTFNWIQSLLYNFLALASWEYSRTVISDPALLALREPEEGKPAVITDRSGALISQDLANSILEISAMGASLAPGSVVIELGAGYGRDACAMLATTPGIKYVIVDIPPALWVAETYLRNQFPGLRIFSYREFTDFSEIEAEFRECDIAFFLSTQITMLPAGLADLGINISSLHEMRLEQIAFYLSEFDRLLKDEGTFYLKQWKRGVIPFESTVIRQEDYPIPVSWRCEFSREAPIQTRFFEARYRKSGRPSLACPICGNRCENRTHVAREMMLGLRDEFRYLECGNCRCVHLIDPPADMSKYYPENYYSFVPAGRLETALEDGRAAYALGKWSPMGWLSCRLFGPHAAMTAIRGAGITVDARVLDVGCGAGSLVSRMKQFGYRHVSGIDPYIQGDLRLSDGVVILKRSVQEMTGEFDVIMLHHSFEHIPDQACALRQIRRLLGPAGRVLIRIPIADSFAWKHYGVNWVHLDAPRHLFLHSPKSLQMLAEQCGLQVVKLTYEGNAGQFVASEQYAKNIALADQRSGGALQQLQNVWRARRYRARAEKLNRNAEGDWACFELQAQPISPP